MVMSTYHPFQKLCYPNPSGDKSLLLAATGPYILSLDLQNGGVLSKWPADTQGLEESSNTNMNNSHADDESPNKRRKISPSEEVDEQHSRESSVSIEFVSERAKDQRRKKKKIVKSTLPNVSQIISTADGAHVIAVTAEDKCIRVYATEPLGRLKPLSERKESLVFAKGIAYCDADVCPSDSVQ